MANTFVNQLSNICTDSSEELSSVLNYNLQHASDGLCLKQRTSVGSVDLNGLSPDDFFLYTHHYNTDEYVTYKAKIADLEYLLYRFRLSQLSADLSAAYRLKEMASMNVSDLNLGALSSRSYILSSNIKNTFDPDTYENALPLEMIEANWKDVVRQNLRELSVEQGFGKLSQYNRIGRSSEIKPPSNNRWFLDELVCDARNLARMDYDQLNLHRLASVDIINLAVDYGKYLQGQLDFKNGVTNYESTISGLVLKYLPLATDTTTGVVRTGSICPNTSRPRQYPIKMDGKNTSSPSALYVEVPWVDTNTFSTYSLSAGGNNTLIFTEYKVNQSLSALSAHSGTMYMNVRENKVSEPISYEVKLNPYIKGNVVLRENLINKSHNQCLARFSADRSHLVIEDGPSFSAGVTDEFLTRAGTWQKISTATASTGGLMTPEDKAFVGEMKELQTSLGGKFYELSSATNTRLGGIRTGYSPDYVKGKYPVCLDDNAKAYVQIPNQVDQYQSTIGSIADNSISEMLKQLYPVGAIYITAAADCPLSTLIPGSTWKNVAQGRCLWGFNGSSPKPGTNIEAGLPNHWHTVTYQVANCGCGKDGGIRSSHSSPTHGSANTGTAQTARASNGIYGNSTTVQPPAYVVNMFQRTA